jgi:hypothetical protein
VEWTHSDVQEAQPKKSNTRGEIPSHFGKAVADSQPCLSPRVFYVGTVGGLGNPAQFEFFTKW